MGRFLRSLTAWRECRAINEAQANSAPQRLNQYPDACDLVRYREGQKLERARLKQAPDRLVGPSSAVRDAIPGCGVVHKFKPNHSGKHTNNPLNSTSVQT
jgi:hypothetical protein